MRVVVAVVGRVRGVLAEAVEQYEHRAGRYWKLEWAQVNDGVRGGSATPERVKAAEAERLLARLPPELEWVALTREGETMSSPALARYLQEHALQSSAGVAFVIGGAFGLDESILRHARRRLSLSEMTLPHEMARLVLAEQLYRAGTIARGEPYHKG